ncbi:MAG: DUF167 domain-containing protein [Propionibacteriaceae bacterium]|nr:DUF167 domain-containing protein [Propionibacteriaceae bacterium]
MKVAIRVKPGSSRNHIGGIYQTSDTTPPALIVSTTTPAIAGRANAAVLKLLAKALRVRSADITQISGHTSRNKLLEIPDSCADSWSALLSPAKTI